MEYQKLTNLLDTTSDNVPDLLLKNGSKFMISLVVLSKQIRFITAMLRSDLCDFSDAYTVVTGNTTVADLNNANYNKKLAFKNNAQFFLQFKN